MVAFGEQGDVVDPAELQRLGKLPGVEGRAHPWDQLAGMEIKVDVAGW
jgi:hypothetical protein